MTEENAFYNLCGLIGLIVVQPVYLVAIPTGLSRILSPVPKRPEREPGHSSPCIADVKNEFVCASLARIGTVLC